MSLRPFLQTWLPAHRAIEACNPMKLLSSSKCFGGEQRVYSHPCIVLNCEMVFGVYIPPAVIEDNVDCPVLYHLSGLTANHENYIKKSGMQQHAAKHGIIVVNPDTSPRKVDIPGQNESYDIGAGAGFYVDATKTPWSKHYKMYSYVTKELVELVNSNLPVLPNKKSICGHSMGGHGALICALKNPGLYQSVSAFAAVCNPVKCVLAQKAYTAYLGEHKEDWRQWDATCLAECYEDAPIEILLDQGSADESLKQNILQPENFLCATAKNKNINVILKQREGYDHSHYFVTSFIAEHFNYHAKRLKN